MSRRDLWLGLVSVFVGPLIGGVTFIAAAIAIDAMVYGEGTPNFMAQHWPIILTAGYVFGTIPGLVFAVIIAVLSRRIAALRQRLLVAAIVGAVVSVGLLSLVLFGGSLSGLDPVVAAALGITGAVAGVISLGLVEFFHPLPAPAKAAP